MIIEWQRKGFKNQSDRRRTDQIFKLSLSKDSTGRRRGGPVPATVTRAATAGLSVTK